MTLLSSSDFYSFYGYLSELHLHVWLHAALPLHHMFSHSIVAVVLLRRPEFTPCCRRFSASLDFTQSVCVAIFEAVYLHRHYRLSLMPEIDVASPLVLSPDWQSTLKLLVLIVLREVVSYSHCFIDCSSILA